EIELVSPPFDSISSLEFSPASPNHLLVASWDTSLRLYDIASNSQKVKLDHKAAVLDCAFSDSRHALSGGLDTWVREFDLETQRAHALGQHDESVSQVVYSGTTNTVITGSWDRTIRTWDTRASAPCTGTYTLPERIYHVGVTGTTLVVGMAGRQFHIYDIRKLQNGSEPKQRRESSMKYMTRALACMSDGQGYATASVEGRIAVEYFDPSPEAQNKKYAFKCHRQTVNGEDQVWPVNALAFHPIHNTFASAGGDGTVSIWDHTAKKRLRQYPKYSLSVQDIAFNVDGSRLAVGVSYGWEQGPEQAAKNVGSSRVYVREVGDEVKVRNFLQLPFDGSFSMKILVLLLTLYIISKRQKYKTIICPSQLDILLI
ncbi:WD40 repeat-like protein, partial [Hysterangium stoloniferum]